ncbi:MAG: hypothetical protein IK079_05825 [Desulfovibrio sp.]|nr:hypothetical protein [Desulfovibrio sp.]
MKLLIISRLLFCCMLCSRFLGFFRDLCIAWVVGGGIAADILACALRIPHLFRRLLAEGVLSSALTKVLVENQSPSFLYVRFQKAVAYFLFIASLLVVIFANPLAQFLAPSLPESWFERTAALVSVTAPYIFFIGLAAVNMAYLHSRNVFWVSAVSPVVANLVLLGCLAVIVMTDMDSVLLLVLGVSISGFAQWAFQSWMVHTSLKRLDAEKAACETKSVPVWGVLGRASVGIFACSAQHCTMFVAMIFLSQWGTGQVAAQFYAERILELPFGLIGVSLGMASLPLLSGLVVHGKQIAFQRSLTLALSWAWILVLPASIGLAVVGEDLLLVLYAHGHFDIHAVEQTNTVLTIYAYSLPACVVAKVLTSACLAQRGEYFVAFTTCLCIMITVWFSAMGLYPPLVVGMVLWGQAGLLWIWLCVFVKGLAQKMHFTFFVRVVFCALCAGLVSKTLLVFWKASFGTVGFFGLIAVCLLTVLVWYLVLWLICRQNANKLRMLLQRKMGIA